MLVLSRKRFENIVLSGGIRISVVEIRGDKVRIGIDAPKEVAVHREEVAMLIEAASQDAAKLNQAKAAQAEA